MNGPTDDYRNGNSVMTNDRKASVIPSPGKLLKARLDRGRGDVMDRALLERAEAAVQGMSEDYHLSALDDIAELRGLARAVAEGAADDESATGRIYSIALDVKGQGATFGYPLVTQIGDSLVRFMDGRTRLGRRGAQIVAAHADALRAVLGNDIRGDGGPLGAKLLGGLSILLRKPVDPKPAAGNDGT